MRRLLLTVEWASDTFGFKLGAGLIPLLSYRTLPNPPPATIILEQPDGSERTVEAGYGQVHLNLPYADRLSRETWMAICYLKGLTPAEVSTGSLVWYDDDDNPPALSSGRPVDARAERGGVRFLAPGRVVAHKWRCYSRNTGQRHHHRFNPIRGDRRNEPRAFSPRSRALNPISINH